MKKFKIAVAFCLLPVSYIFAQETIKGKVLSPDQKPLSGVTVTVSETGASTTTDQDGSFQMNDLNKGNTLIFNYPDYSTQEIIVDEKTVLNIILAGEKVKNIDEIVMTGYTKQKKADITGAVSIVEMKELNKQGEPNPVKSLQGRVAGVNISTDGSPSGGNTKVLIRGVGTLNNTDPLYVIDGVPTKAGMHELNPSDIESMQVLKDASSASIYGSRAANGVIIITTKKGKKGSKIAVDFSANLTAQFYSNQSKMKLMNSSQYATAMAQAALNDGLDPVAYAANYGINLNAAAGTHITVWNPATN